MGFVRLVAAEEVELREAIFHRALEGKDVGQPAGRFAEPIGVDAALIGVDCIGAAEVVFGREGRAVELEPRHPQLTPLRAAAQRFAVEIVKLGRRKAALIAECAAAASGAGRRGCPRPCRDRLGLVTRCQWLRPEALAFVALPQLPTVRRRHPRQVVVPSRGQIDDQHCLAGLTGDQASRASSSADQEVDRPHRRRRSTLSSSRSQSSSFAVRESATVAATRAM